MEQDQLRVPASNLKELSTTQFGALSPAEMKLVLAAPEGVLAVCGPSDDDQDRANDPSLADNEPHGWGGDRQIRAEFIRWLCVDGRARYHIDPRGIQVQGAKITGRLDLSWVAVPFPLGLFNCRLTDNAYLVSIEIPDLDFRGSWFQALDCDRAKVKGSVFLSRGFRAQGEVRLVGAQIAGDLDCDGGTFMNPPRENISGSGTALNGDGITVMGNIFLRENFRAEGEVYLIGAQINGDLNCAGGGFINPLKQGLRESGAALRADRASVNGSVLFRDGFGADGSVVLRSARIGGYFDCRNGTFRADLDCSNASAGSIRDDEKSWPDQGRLHLNGFIFDRIYEGPQDAQSRLKWLGLQPEKPAARRKFAAPQAYLQLAKVLREAGDDHGAKRVLVEMEHRRGSQNFIDAVWRSVFRVTIGYGYCPLWAFWEVLVLIVLGWAVYERSYVIRNIVPTDKDAYVAFKHDGQPPGYYPGFVPLIYSLENSLPLVKLGQTEKWQPDPISAIYLRYFLWFQILLGWFLATLFVAGVTGVVHKE